MKIKIGDKVYLQKYDVSHILGETNEIPASFFQEVFSNSNCFFMCGDKSDGFYFEKIFKDPGSVKWLMEQDWLVNYDEYKDTSLLELEVLRDSLIKSYKDAAIALNAKEGDCTFKRYEEEKDKLNKLTHKITSIECLIAFRKGQIKFLFPPEYHGRTTYDIPSEEKPSFFKRLFGRKK